MSPNDLAKRVMSYLQVIAPRGAGNAEICRVVEANSHQAVFQVTRNLVRQGLIRGERGFDRKGEWRFFAGSAPIPGSREGVVAGDRSVSLIETAEISTFGSALAFERLAEQIMSQFYGKSLRKGSLPGVPKIFDLVSDDGSVVGDAKYYTLVHGQALPPAKFSVIAEHVWLLEKVPAVHRFLVFGRKRTVPELWLRRYGRLVRDVAFFFLSDHGQLERLA